MYSQDTPPTWDNSTKIELGTDIAVSNGDNEQINATTIDSLAQGTTYYARAYATSGNSTWYGDTVGFTTSNIIELSMAIDPEGGGSTTPEQGTSEQISANQPQAIT